MNCSLPARVVGVSALAITIAGGYGRDIATTVQVHVNTVKAAVEHA